MIATSKDMALPAPSAETESPGGEGESLQVPGTLNIALALAIVAAGIGLQWMASHAASWLTVAAVGVAFSFLYLPLYSLLHEAEHRVFHGNEVVNEAFGVLLAVFFPGPFTFLRACHLGHHRRNRSEAERFDLYYPGESLGKKRLEFFFLYLGGFWLLVPLATIGLLLWPSILRSSLVQDAPEAAAMINGVPKGYVRRIRLEALLTVGVHAALILALGLRWEIYALLYGLYGLSWSAQQYITHADSPRHVLNGAHNLKAYRPYELLLLHFNWHLAHHQHPKVSWLYLPRLDDPTRIRPGYLTAFFHFWRGPQLTRKPETPP
jgi:fatty acid desaturase